VDCYEFPPSLCEDSRQKKSWDGEAEINLSPLYEGNYKEYLGDIINLKFNELKSKMKNEKNNMLDNLKSPVLIYPHPYQSGLNGAYNPAMASQTRLAALLLIWVWRMRVWRMTEKNKTYTKIPNELIDKLISYRLPGEEMKIFFMILRQTLGWGKKSDQISLSQFAEKTGMKKPSVLQCLNSLLAKKLITVSQKANDLTKTYSIPDTSGKSWKPLAKKLTLANSLTTVSQFPNKPLANSLPTKETLKETLKEIPPLYPPEGDLDKPSKNKPPKKKPNDYTPDFLKFWEIYPRKEDKGRALKSWNNALKRGITPEMTIAGLTRNFNWLKEQATKDPLNNYCKKACYWLDDDCYLDDHSAPAVENPPSLPPAAKLEFRPHPDGSGLLITKDGRLWTPEKKKYLNGGIQSTCSPEILRKVFKNVNL